MIVSFEQDRLIQVIEAAIELERRGKRFCVDFGYENAREILKRAPAIRKLPLKVMIKYAKGGIILD